MKILLFVLLMLALTLPSHQYYYEKPLVSFQEGKIASTPQDFRTILPGTTVIKGLNGKTYEVTMSSSRPIYEKHLTVQQIMAMPPQPAPSQLNSLHNENFPQSFDNQQQHLNFNSTQFNEKTTDNGAQNNYHLLAKNSHQQQPQAQEQTGILPQQQQQQITDNNFFQNIPQQQEQQQQAGTFAQIIQQQVAKLAQGQQQQQQQQQYNQQQFEQNVQQPLPNNNNLPNMNNLLNDLVNNHKYVSQSEASQLDAYAYEQINGNPRPFTRTISKCDDALGQCEPQSATAEVIGGSDFHHQQVLKQTKAQLEPTADKCQNKFNYQFTGNELTNDAAKERKGIPIKKGTDLKDRRLFLYTEAVLSQYPDN